jgi:mono/diheme cytochrome c family protein
MAYSRAYETYSPNPNFGDSMTMREPVMGTVPREMIPFAYEKTDEDLARAGRELDNPVQDSEADLQRGKELFVRMCQQCHGGKGDGQGFLYTSNLYIYPPGVLTSEQIVSRSDGEIYHIITAGRNVMGAHGAMIRPEDRWNIVLYVRELQKNALPQAFR